MRTSVHQRASRANHSCSGETSSSVRQHPHLRLQWTRLESHGRRNPKRIHGSNLSITFVASPPVWYVPQTCRFHSTAVLKNSKTKLTQGIFCKKDTFPLFRRVIKRTLTKPGFSFVSKVDYATRREYCCVHYTNMCPSQFPGLGSPIGEELCAESSPTECCCPAERDVALLLALWRRGEANHFFTQFRSG